MNFNNLDFLVYSSHKTSTQSIVEILNIHDIKTIHCHHINNFKFTLANYNGLITDETFIQGLINYKNTNDKKMKIISIIRNPKDRLISSFFQSFSTDEVEFLKKNENNTTIIVTNVDDLCIMY